MSDKIRSLFTAGNPIPIPVQGDDDSVASGRADIHHAPMEDKDVSRLEDRIEAANRESVLRIEAVNREGQLRLDAAMARIDGKLDVITQTLSGLKTEMAEARTVARTWGMWAVGATVAVGITILVAIPATLLGLKQVWIGGVQVGQSISAPTSPPIKP